VAFDRHRAPIVDLVLLPGAAAPIPEETERFAVAALEEGAEPAAGWTRRSRLVQVHPSIFLGDGCTIRSQGPSRLRRRRGTTGCGPTDGSALTVGNRRRDGNGSTQGWTETWLPCRTASVALLVRDRRENGAEWSGGGHGLRVLLDRAPGEGEELRAEIELGELDETDGERLLACDVPAGLAGPQEGRLRVLVHGAPGLELTGVIGLTESLNARTRASVTAFLDSALEPAGRISAGDPVSALWLPDEGAVAEAAP